MSSFEPQSALSPGLLADTEQKKLKSVWFWSAVLSAASGLLRSEHGSDGAFGWRVRGAAPSPEGA